jgi:hypothetical protein
MFLARCFSGIRNGKVFRADPEPHPDQPWSRTNGRPPTSLRTPFFLVLSPSSRPTRTGQAGSVDPQSRSSRLGMQLTGTRCVGLANDAVAKTQARTGETGLMRWKP